MRKTMKAVLLGLVLGVSTLAQGQEAPWTREQFAEQLEAKNFQQLDAQLLAFQEPALNDWATFRAYSQAVNALTAGRPAKVAVYDEWVAATNSGAAHLVRGEFQRDRAWLARGGTVIDG